MKSCQFCGAPIELRARASSKESAERKFCSQTCSNRSHGAARMSGIRARFASYVVEGPECWAWTGAKDPHGYGRFRVGGRKGKPELAHRVSYVFHAGEIPDGAELRHTCDHPWCVNPKHLVPGTHAENMKDFAERGHGNRGTSNGQHKLTEEEIPRVRALIAAGQSSEDIGNALGVSRMAIDRIKDGRGWRHVP